MLKPELNIKNKKIKNEIFKILEGIPIKSVSNCFRFYEEKFKIVVFAPQEISEELILKMSSAGAGVIGNYTVCSFRTAGLGTFLGNEVSNPRVGRRNNLETVNEYRIEMICEKTQLDNVIEQIYKSHPYEEPAIDVYTVLTPGNLTTDKIFKFELSRSTRLDRIVKNINSFLKISLLKIPDTKIQRVIIDYTGWNLIPFNNKAKPAVLIKRNKNITEVELV